MHNFAVVGVAGFVAPRHLHAIQETGHRVVAALDPNDSVGLLDHFGHDIQFFTEADRFDRHLDRLRRGPEAGRVDYLSVCSPNDLHDAHCRLGLGTGADVICEKPLVVDPRNLDHLQRLEDETGHRVWVVLQLRLHPALIAMREALAPDASRHRVQLTYVTARGPWYDVSWKGSDARSGGIAINIGIHLFDLLIWCFGPVDACDVTLREPHRAAGTIGLERADVEWRLSTDRRDLPPTLGPSATTHRSITVDGRQVDFSGAFGQLHTRVYEEILARRGFGIDDARPSIDLANRIRHAPVRGLVAPVVGE